MSKADAANAKSNQRTPIKSSGSQNRGQIRANVPPTILEIEDETVDLPRGRSASQASRASKTSGADSTRRNHSVMNSNRSILRASGSYDNHGFDAAADRRSIASGTSSQNPSVLSMQVQKEQYCCFSKWSPCERKLTVFVAVLATIIIVLVIVMGLMSRGGEKDKIKIFPGL